MKIFWKYLILIMVTAVIVGGLTYYFVNKKATIAKNTLQSQIDELNTKIAASAGDPAIVVTNFYNWYNGAHTDLSSIISAPGSSQDFQDWYTAASNASAPEAGGGGSNPIDCAQDTPPSFNAVTLSKNATSAAVKVTENFTPVQDITVNLKLVAGSWKLSSVTCPKAN